nr:RNA-dependent RNA polymerase [Sarcosphaera coronaria partitivirus]
MSLRVPFNNVRNYLAERLSRVRTEWSIFNKNQEDPSKTLEDIQDSDIRRLFSAAYVPSKNKERFEIFKSEYNQIVSALKIADESRDQPFELRRPYYPDETIPDNREPAPGIKLIPFKYHSGHVIHENPETSRPLQPDEESDNAESYLPGDIDFGPDVDPLIRQLIVTKYPEYLNHVNKFCRPAGTTNGTFRDFNKEQVPSAPIDPERKERVLNHVFHFLDATPYLPLHFVDTQYDKRPLVTGTGYHNRFSYAQRAHARFSKPSQYEDRPTSRGYFYNATYEHARTMIHKIKETGMPFNLAFAPEDENLTDDQIYKLISKYEDFFLDYPTLLFTRNHISDREKTLKVRPVYAVDDLFLIIESMLTFPLLVQARKPSCCIMYGLETIRGSNCYLDKLALSFETFFTIDWSGYDQRLPRIITDIYYTDFLRRLIVINHGYQPTYEYPSYPDLTEHSLYRKMDNLLHFLHMWYNNMAFLSIDGYAYWRLFAGVPSGLFNTQYLDSFANLFILVDALIEFGCSDEEIRQITLFVLGDDNSGFTLWPLSRLVEFITFLESYALRRYNMVLSKTKSVITALRSKIESLGYQCNFGRPKRPIDKLVAQLAYPEHKIKYHTMSARAIGLAYASCGNDPTFYAFCYDVFCTFLPYYKPDPRQDLQLARMLQKTDDEQHPFRTEHLQFPTIETIRKCFDKYQGPLSYEPKWNKAHFINDPDIIPPSAKTMHDYEIENDIKPRLAPTFRQADLLPLV